MDHKTGQRAKLKRRFWFEQAGLREIYPLRLREAARAARTLARALAAPQREKKQQIFKETGFAGRISAAAAAKKAQLDKFKPRTTVSAPDFVDRRERRAAELQVVRDTRAEQRAATLQTRADAEQSKAAAALEAEQVALETKRQERKSRKTAQKVDAALRRQDRRDALQAYVRSSPR